MTPTDPIQLIRIGAPRREPASHLALALAAIVVLSISVRAEAVIATIPVAGSGGGIAMTPDGTRAYVASGPVSVIDTATAAVVQSFVAAAGSVTAVAISPDGSHAFFTTNGNDIFGSGGGVSCSTPRRTR